MTKGILLKQLILYILMALVFSLASYGIINVIVGGFALSMLEWFGIMGLAFGIGYIPFFLESRKTMRGGG